MTGFDSDDRTTTREPEISWRYTWWP